jgi:protein-L-isoaspartate(D-aspartate) O-methyltransferase
MGQTISQPYIVALMTQELRLNPDCEVLEVGTGSGYQTAVLAKLTKKVYTIERFAQLSESAQAVLSNLRVKNIEFCIGDGSCGWPHKRIFDRIMVTAGVPTVPQPLADQLADGGIIVAPVGAGAVQQLITCEKKKEKLVERVICGCRFVKLLGEYGFDETQD